MPTDTPASTAATFRWIGAAVTALIAVLAAVQAIAQGAGQIGGGTPDYANAKLWLCRPGQEEACTAKLDATVLNADGTTSKRSYPAARDDAAIDCFYVYPTASREQTPLSDFAPSPELLRAVRVQVGRLGAHCRLFAPIYRQVTLAGLAANMRGGGGGAGPSPIPFNDVLAAWRSYLTRDNHGRGVILIGHSQGTILLQKLIAQEIDGKPAQKLLVSAILGGDPSLGVPRGGAVGGTFKSIPVCATAGQLGCVFAWGSYRADDQPAFRVFGRNPADGGMVAACANPATPAGGAVPLKAILPRARGGGVGDPEWLVVEGQISGGCVRDAKGAVFRVAIGETKFAGEIADIFRASSVRPAWGLHRLDMSLVQGNMIDLVKDQADAWAKRGAK